MFGLVRELSFQVSRPFSAAAMEGELGPELGEGPAAGSSQVCRTVPMRFPIFHASFIMFSKYFHANGSRTLTHFSVHCDLRVIQSCPWKFCAARLPGVQAENGCLGSLGRSENHRGHMTHWGRGCSQHRQASIRLAQAAACPLGLCHLPPVSSTPHPACREGENPHELIWGPAGFGVQYAGCTW